jgi:hypothetical protein
MSTTKPAKKIEATPPSRFDEVAKRLGISVENAELGAARLLETFAEDHPAVIANVLMQFAGPDFERSREMMRHGFREGAASILLQRAGELDQQEREAVRAIARKMEADARAMVQSAIKASAEKW